jgi:predicted nucleotidyltransferase
MKYSADTVDKYRNAWHERAIKTKVRNAFRRQKALQYAQECSNMLVDRFGVKKVVLFGSVLSEDGFNKDSDIDIAVEGIEKYFNAVAECQSDEFSVDIIESAKATPLMKERVAKGMVLYERK